MKLRTRSEGWKTIVRDIIETVYSILKITTLNALIKWNYGWCIKLFYKTFKFWVRPDLIIKQTS